SIRGGRAPSGGWRPRSYDDGDITPTNEAAVALHEGGGTLPRPRGLVRPRPIAKITAKTRPTTNDGTTMVQVVKRPPSPPKRQSSRADLHSTASSPSLSLPAYPSGSRVAMARMQPKLHHSVEVNPGLESSSSTESDSLPFANENAGTIKQRAARPHPTLTTMDYPNQIPTSIVSVICASKESSALSSSAFHSASRSSTIHDLVTKFETTETAAGQEPADVLNDIGNMLANLTDELDAMLEEEKRQGLSQ
ncbi:hypothetical protein L9F63_026174, partial [Diploptera punctata]